MKTSGLGDNFYVGGYDLSGDITSMDEVSGGPVTLGATAIKQTAEARLFGLRSGTVKFTTLFENTPAISTPGFPLTTVPVTNVTGFPVFVTISGGTLTFVFVNSIQVGTTAGTYPVPIGGTISITYSAAPTWSWFALGEEHNALAPLPRTDATCMYARGTAVGGVAACCIGRQLNYDGTRDNTGNLTFQVEVDSDSFGLEWCTLLTAGLRTDTTATAGAFIDQGAQSVFGAQAYVELIELVGTNVDISIQHATTSGGSYTSLIDFGSMTTYPQAARGSVSNSTTVNEFIKVVTTGTFSYATFAVAMNRNTIAGVTF
jgi:hypothetical protein